MHCRSARAVSLALRIAIAGSSVGLPAQDRLLQAADLLPRAAAAKALDAALAEDDARAEREVAAAARLAALRTEVALAIAELPTGSRAHARGTAMLAAAAGTGDRAPRAHACLRLELADLAADLEFRPVEQAPLPKGFPAFAALDEIELRDYPAYRMVRAELRRGGTMGAFWPLFRHIESHGIAMTTPVQMDWPAAEEKARADSAVSMAFLYGDPALGQLGKDDVVEVVDVPAMQVLTLGARGHDSRPAVAELEQALRTWLAANPRWAQAGPLRTMNYNSPMIARDRRYFEVQLPVAPVATPR